MKKAYNFLIAAIFGYMVAYFSVFPAFTNPGSQNSWIYLLIHFIISSLILYFLLDKVVMKTKSKKKEASSNPLNVSLIISGFIGLLIALVLQVYTLLQVKVRLGTPFASLDSIRNLNNSVVIYAYIVIAVVSGIDNLRSKALKEEKSKLMRYSLIWIFIVAATNYVGYGIYFATLLGW